ncbi:MAG: tetratricopeptide repeat protein [Alphaproteobacteria bacterium]|nr:tetratricopeptide repeat protein [Alphaproteobacteria bacterium]
MNRHENELRDAATRGDWAAAVAAGDAWIAEEPDHAPAHALAGYAVEHTGDIARACAMYETALLLDPTIDNVRANRAALLVGLGRFDEAGDEVDAVLLRVPDHALATAIAAHLAGSRAVSATERGRALAAKGDLAGARVEFERAMHFAPDDPGVRLNYGRILRRLGKNDEARGGFRTAAARDPADPVPLAELLMLARDIADWRETETLEAELRLRIDGGSVLPPFVGFFLDLDPGTSRNMAERWARRQAPVTRVALESSAGGKLRIGYLSEHFRRHATTHLLAEVLEQHDRSKIELFLYSYGPDDRSAERARIAAAGNFVDIAALDDDAAAARIANDKLDVLVDLMGYVERNRFGIVRRKPAPVIVEFLGYPATTGDACVDWVLADPTTIPPGAEDGWTERVWRLPHSYQPNDRKRPVAAIPTRLEAGLPERGFVYCCFNHVWKLTPSVFDGWLRILAAVPDSVLWLMDGPAAANLRARAKAQRIDPARLVFAPPLPLDKHLARLSLADLVLDTHPYGAHTTASDALWVGVPILTAMREAFPARVAASLAKAAGQAGGIVAPEDYESEAIALASDPAKLAALKASLTNRASSPLFDAAAMAHALEDAYAKMRDGVPATPRIEVKPAPLNICFVDPSDLDFRPDTPDHQALGGSQSGFAYLARRLAARGHRVTTLTATTQPGMVDGVTAESHDGDPAEALAGRRFDATIVLNDAGPGRALREALPDRAKLLLWTQHAHDQPAMFALSDPSPWDLVVAISDWHRAKMIETYRLDPAATRIRRNAIAPVFEDIEFGTGDAPARLVYTSTPFRGLTVLLGVFPRIRDMFPGTTLDVFSSLAVYQVAAKDDPFAQLAQYVRDMPGVNLRGSIPQRDLARELARADFLAYPSVFAETGCIAAMEAVAAGLDVVSSRLGALPEATMGFGKLAAIDPIKPGNDAFVRRYLEILAAAIDARKREPAKWRAERVHAAKAMREEGTWTRRALEWERLLVAL